MKSKPLLLYLNLGTPASPKVSDVRRYLREFLSDPMVIDIPALPRWMLVNLIIAPTRAPKSARAYEKIWGAEGSPLLVYSKRLVQKIQQKIGDEADVELVMRYGEPNIKTVLRQYLSRSEKERPTQIYVMPAYPQYALSSTETGFQAVSDELKVLNYQGESKVIFHYETFDPFIRAVSERVQKVLSEKKSDHVLFSFHGLPMRQIAKVSPSLNYRDQCFATAHAVAKVLRLQPKDYSVGFQSRLGSGWIQPYTDQLYVELAKQGVKKLAVVCPSFTADCLETLEEVALRGREAFLAAGGEDLILVPCVNDGDDWAEAVIQLYRHGPWRPLNA